MSQRPPVFVEPMAAKLVDRLPEGEDWLYEVKLDGYRALGLKHGDKVRLVSRRNKDLTPDFPSIVAGLVRVKAHTVVLDGEIVAHDDAGRPSFQALQNRRPRHVTLYAFDVLHIDGNDLTAMPLATRKAALSSLLSGSGILISEPLAGTASDVIEAVRQLGLEGVIAKRRSSRYEPGKRSGAWVKLKLDQQQEFVIGGYKPGFDGFDSLLVGYYENARLLFAAKVRAGFTPASRRAVASLFKGLQTTRCPFADLPTNKSGHWGEGITAEDMPSLRWLEPKLVAQVRFVEWTTDQRLRHASFVGMREDKKAKQVRRET
jgi:bifunctional non-homologous end joining protein LigD